MPLFLTPSQSQNEKLQQEPLDKPGPIDRITYQYHTINVQEKGDIRRNSAYFFLGPLMASDP